MHTPRMAAFVASQRVAEETEMLPLFARYRSNPTFSLSSEQQLLDSTLFSNQYIGIFS